MKRFESVPRGSGGVCDVKAHGPERERRMTE